MPRSPTNLLAATIATALCFAGFVAFGIYGAVDENIGAGFLSFVFMVLTLGSAIWCISAFVIQRRRRVELRGFPVLTVEKGERTTVGPVPMTQPSRDKLVRSSTLDYQTPPPRAKCPFFTPAGWFLLAGFCAFAEVAGWFATNGRIGGWGDIAFIVAIAVVGLISLMEGFRSARRRAKAG